MASQWYYSRNKRKLGPVSSSELRQLATAGQLLPTDMVLKVGHDKWIPATAVKGLFADNTGKALQPVRPVTVAPQQPSSPSDLFNAKVYSAAEGIGKWMSAKAEALAKALSVPPQASGATSGRSEPSEASAAPNNPQVHRASPSLSHEYSKPKIVAPAPYPGGRTSSEPASPIGSAVIQALRAELEELNAERAAAETEAAQVSGGLVKGWLQRRVEVIKTSESLLVQRINALESGVRQTIEASESQPDEALARELKRQFETETEKVKLAKLDAGGYGRSLVGATKDMGVAIQQNTLAIIKQRYLVAKYGLPKAV